MSSDASLVYVFRGEAWVYLGLFELRLGGLHSITPVWWNGGCVTLGLFLRLAPDVPRPTVSYTYSLRIDTQQLQVIKFTLLDDQCSTWYARTRHQVSSPSISVLSLV